MQAPFDNIVQHLFHQPSLQSVTVDELERMAQDHPYFAAAHFLLLKKMQQTAHPQFDSQLHKTTLYFNNPLWLQFLLQPETVQGFTVLNESPFIAEEAAPVAVQENGWKEVPVSIAETPDPVHLPLVTADEQQPVVFSETVPDTNNETELIPPAPAAITAPAGIMDVITEVFQEDMPTVAQQPSPFVAESPEIIIPAAIDQEPADEQTVVAPETAGSELAAAPEPEEASVEEEAPIPQDTWLPDTLVTVVNEQEGQAVAEYAPEIVSPEEVPAPIVAAEPIFSDETNAVAENPEEADATDVPAGEAIQSESPLLKSIVETTAASSDTLFEPYHTVDYFASQGIKLSKQENDAKDKLGRQLKSFTEWLKTMKRLPQVSIDKLLSENEESKVVADAIHSIENKEVITEAMAEVFEKQGMNEKAVEVYQKLSLLNPAKSTYFAAKIAILKH